MKTLFLTILAIGALTSVATAEPFDIDGAGNLIPGYCAERFDEPALGVCIKRGYEGHASMDAAIRPTMNERQIALAMSICRRELSNGERPGLDLDFRVGTIGRFFACMAKFYSPPARN